MDFNSLTALAQAHHDAFGRNTTLNVVAVNNRGYINAAPHANGVVVKYQRNEIGDNAYTPKMAYDITQTTTWDQLTYAVSQELNVPYEECSNYTQHKLNEPGTSAKLRHSPSVSSVHPAADNLTTIIWQSKLGNAVTTIAVPDDVEQRGIS